MSDESPLIPVPTSDGMHELVTAFKLFTLLIPVSIVIADDGALKFQMPV